MACPSRTLAGAALVTTLLGMAACGSDPTPVDATRAAAEPSIASSSSTTAAPTTVAPPTAPTSDQEGSGATTTVEFLGETRILGHFHLPDGVFVRLSADTDSDEECSRGRLGVRIGGRLVHVYEDPADVGALHLLSGPFGQTVLVERCEESVERLVFTDTSVPPPDGIPELVVTTPPETVVELVGLEWGTTGLLHARGTFAEDATWTDDVVFDAFDGSMRTLADSMGAREVHPGGDVDVVVPTSWVLDSGSDATDQMTLRDPESDSMVVITELTPPLEPPAPRSGEIFRSGRSVAVERWELVGGTRRARPTGALEALDFLFASDSGDRLVRRIEVDGRIVEIDAFTDAALGADSSFVPELLVDQVRVFSAG